MLIGGRSQSIITLEDIKEPYYMVFDSKKFWEISVISSDLVSICRAGKLMDNFQEEPTSIQSQVKQHDSKESLLDYVQKNIAIKKSKGYTYKVIQNNNNISQGKRQSEQKQLEYEPEIVKKVQTQQQYLQIPQENRMQQQQVQQEIDLTFNGDYLDRSHMNGDGRYYQIQIQESWVLEEWGNKLENKHNDKFTNLASNKDCVIYAQKQILSKIQQGYKSNTQQFKYTMNIFGDDNNNNNNGNSSSTRESIIIKDQISDSISISININNNNSKQRRGFKGGQQYLDNLRRESVVTEQQQQQQKQIQQRDKQQSMGPKINIYQSNSPTRESYSNNNNNNNEMNSYLSVNSQRSRDYSQNSKRSSIYVEEGDWEIPNDEDWVSQGQKVTGTKQTRSRGRSPQNNNNNESRDIEEYNSNGKWCPLGAPTNGAITVLLAEKWDENMDPQGWYMSEKLDGVRCYWNGRTLYSRNKNVYSAPKFFTENWPNSPLDGELFLGRDKFQKCVSYVRKNTPIDSEWEQIQFIVFDAPNCHMIFEKRIKKIEEVIQKANSPYLVAHKHEICNGTEHLIEALRDVEEQQGEGMMLRDPKSYYENRRSKSLLKVKTFHDDEAVVLAHEKGEGRCAGMVGALRCKNKLGVIFSVGSGMNDDIRRHPPKIGSTITYKYQSLTKSGQPRFPVFLREHVAL